MAVATKTNLPSTFVSEYEEFIRLYNLGSNRTNTGALDFTSTSSGTTYNSTTGEEGIFQQLGTVLEDYRIEDIDWNQIQIEITSLQNQITPNTSDIASLQSGKEDKTVVESIRVDLQGQIDTNETDIANHISSASAHNDTHIVNNSTVDGAKVRDALNNLDIEDGNLNTRIDNIIAQSGTSSTEVEDARTSPDYGSYTVLKNRLDAIEVRAKFFWFESHTVLKDNNTITLSNITSNNDKLVIYDKKYGAIWSETIHWTKSGNIITFTSDMPEDLIFDIYNIGNITI